MRKNFIASVLTIIILTFWITLQIRSSLFDIYRAIFILPYIISNIAALCMLVLSIKNRPKEINDNNIMFLLCLIAANLPIFVGLFGQNLVGANINQHVRSVAAILSPLGVSLYLPAVINLGRRISVLPVATSLETSGIYSFSRHPLYSIHIYWDILQILIFQSWIIILISAIQICFQIIRAKSEEGILERNFPEYAAYRKKVWWIGRNLFMHEK
jgi:protein-S-isoprenylcysteine O-methyltransferase Ste14